jgi:hypothetical protein
MRTEIIFHPAKNPRYLGNLEPVRGYATSFGLVLHRAIGTFRETLGYWDVSDIETGGMVANGDFPGIEGAVAALVQKAQEFRGYPGGFAGALSDGRRNSAHLMGEHLVLSDFSTGAAVLVSDAAVVELIAGLNATAVKMRDGSEHLVNEAAEVIRWRIHDRTGLSVPIV